MTRIRQYFGSLLLVALVMAWPVGAQAQQAVDWTTFSVAVTNTATSVTLTAASGVAAGGYLYSEGELMQVTSVSGAVAQVRRGVAGGKTPAMAHSASAAIVFVGAGDEFQTYDVAGTCTASENLYNPHINTHTNNVFDCEGGFWLKRSYDSPTNVRSHTVEDKFQQGYAIMQIDGTAKSLTDNENNFVAGSPLGAIEYREELTKTASSWIIDDLDGLDLSADDGATDAEGVDIAFGVTEGTDMGYIVAGSSGGCFEASIDIPNISGTDFLVIGWRQNEAMVDNATPASYTLYNHVGIYDEITGSIIHLESGATEDDSAVDWADGETRALKVCVTKAGVPSAFYSAAYTHDPDITEWPDYNEIPIGNNGTTLTAGTQMVPFLIYLASSEGTDPDPRVQWVRLTRFP